MRKTGKLLLIVAFMLAYVAGYAKEWKSSVAVVVDPVTYEKVGADVDAYVASISNGSRTGVLLIDKWNHPDSIRTALKKMYEENNLEGAVLVGDIPIAMVRGANYLTTAFKMNPDKDWADSSVPSDRFYDDFDLKFDYLKKDETRDNWHYYYLRADSPQKLDLDIYSSRIIVPAIPGEDKYELIAKFLQKAVAQKKAMESMDYILHFAGHGYNSESMNARIDEQVALMEQFPFLKSREGDVEYIDFTFDKYIKNRLKQAVANDDLDLAILHHHGADDTQYMNGTVVEATPESCIEAMRRSFRTKIRKAKDTTKTKNYYIEKYGVPAAWVNDAFNPQNIKKDSLHEASIDLTIPDMYGYRSGAKMVMLDACFNGNFRYGDYIAGYYLFNPGNTMAVKANTVNTLQDTWTNELIGLVNMGVCFGNWAKGQLTLESHLYGDPTFAFKPQPSIAAMFKDFNLDRDIVKEKNNVAFWKKILYAKNSADYPVDLQALAIKMLYKNNAISTAELLEIQKNSDDAVVRLEAFVTSRHIANADFPKAIAMALTDNYELIRRLGAQAASANTSPELMELVAQRYMSPVTSSRELFQLTYAMESYNPQDVIEVFEKYGYNTAIWPGEEAYNTSVRRIRSAYERNAMEFDAVVNDAKMSDKDKRLIMNAQRNKCNPHALPAIYSILEKSDSKQLRLIATDALGWFVLSHKKGEILAKCEAYYANEKDPEIKEQLLKTINRLK